MKQQCHSQINRYFCCWLHIQGVARRSALAELRAELCNCEAMQSLWPFRLSEIFLKILLTHADFTILCEKWAGLLQM